MGQASRTIIVHAFDDQDAVGGISFDMSGFGVQNGEIKCSKDECDPKMKKKDHHKVVFELADRSKRQLRFPDNAADAIWVAADDTKCPDGPSSNAEIKPQTVSPDGGSLTIFNSNSRQARLKFSLVFEERANGKRHIFDPIWDNRNGGVRVQ